METTRYLALIKRWWWLLLAGLLISGVGSYAISKTLTPIYSASTTLLVNQTQVPGTIAYNDILTSERLTRTYKELIEKRPVLDEVIEQLELPYSRDELAGMISVGVVTDTQLLRLSVENADPSMASRIANTAASVFIEQNTESDMARPGEVSIVEAATTPGTPIKPNIRLNAAVAMVIGFMIAAGIALAFEYFDDTVKTIDELQAHGFASLGGVARFRRRSLQENLIAGSRSQHQFAEAYRVLRTNVQFSTIDRPGQKLLVTSANPGEGKSTTAANLALVMAQTGKRVVLIDSDLRRPSLHRFFGLNNEQGLTNLLLSPQPGMNGCAQHTRFENLAVITSGPLPPNPSELLASSRMDALLKSIESQADIVIIDSPPTLPVADASILASKVDGTLIVVDSSRTRIKSLAAAKEALERSKTHILGAVLNKLGRRSGEYYCYHYYYGTDGQKKRRKQRGKPATART